MDFLRRAWKWLSPRGSYPNKNDIREAEARWQEINRRVRERGCLCGKPATHVRRVGGNIGSVPVEMWTCKEHVNVSVWARHGNDEHLTPEQYFGDEVLRWQVHEPVREERS